MPRAAILFPDFGPYHVARIGGMAVGVHGRVRTNETAQGQWLITGSLVWETLI
jgi:hypothetical protein